MNCAICDRLASASADPALVHEFANSYLLLGNHQYYKGYCLLLFKEHVRELHELDEATQISLHMELMQATRAIAQAFKPWKINHACLGNQDEHIHWHIIPRYLSDPDYKQHPWLHSAEFCKHIGDEADRNAAIAAIRKHL
jgi:diadenosine tetraphosphate (Ap4A) HIT family hydrolase